MSEGASSVVYRFNYQPTLMRFKKYDSCIRECIDDYKGLKCANWFNCQDSHEYYTKIMKKIVPERYMLSQFDLFSENHVDFQNICRAIPDNFNGGVNSYSILKDKFILMTDATRILGMDDVWAFEIKPKWGFMNYWPVPPPHHYQNYYCRFCILKMTGLKNPLNQVHEENKYCPVDFFSRCPSRIEHAILNLFSHPQNNLKIFKNGVRQTVESLTQQQIQDFVLLITDAIIDDARINPIENGGGFHYSFCQASENSECCIRQDCHVRAYGGILDFLNQCQRIDRIGIEAISRIWAKMNTKERNEAIQLLSDFSSIIWKDPYFSNISDLFDERESIYLLRDFLLSMTFRDASIIFNFRQIEDTSESENPPPNTVFSDGNLFRYEIRLIDLDPRTPQNIPFYFFTNNHILHTFLKLKRLPSCDNSCNNLDFINVD
uniref:Inositol-pentakisphosphate 2-kinase n=1 Tax=Henneguya salminicola TaxID=69463 RepID=A0A6G3MFB3_HENSL